MTRARPAANEMHLTLPAHPYLRDHSLGNPLGLVGELRTTLDEAHRRALPKRFVWGVRDILAAADYVKRMLAYSGGPKAFRRAVAGYYGAMAYADASWLDALADYRHLVLPARTASVGFVTGPVPETRSSTPPRVVALSGGDAQAEGLTARLLAALAEPLAQGRLTLRLVVGLFTPAPAIEALASARSGVEVRAEGALETAIGDASLVVARVGYNTAYSLARSSLPLVLVPIRSTNGEQDLRASRLAELPGVWTVPEPSRGETRVGGSGRDHGSAVETRLARAIAAGLAHGPRPRPLPLAVDGAATAADWLLRAAEARE